MGAELLERRVGKAVFQLDATKLADIIKEITENSRRGDAFVGLRPEGIVIYGLTAEADGFRELGDVGIIVNGSRIRRRSDELYLKIHVRTSPLAIDLVPRLQKYFI